MVGGRRLVGIMRSASILLRLLAAGIFLAAAAPGQVKVWSGKLTLPVDEEGPPDPNPPFDAFAGARFNYPYTLRTNMTGRRVTANLRALYLENEYLKCSVLPDVGGHLYSCTDKISGKEMFYANPSLKKQLIGYRGAWAAFGIEFNFPVSHNWMSMSPVDFAWRQNADGSGSVFVGNIDRPYGMQWRVELVLRPGSTVLEERVTLYNHSNVRRRYYWWNNAGVEVGDDSKIYYPMRFTASHGFTYVDTWPVNHAGLDVSVIGNQTAGTVSQFVHGSREPFMSVWHPRWNAGVVHYAEYADLPGKKIWSWGVDADGLDWRRALSDNNSAYVEIQAGLYRNQETYAFLAPQTTIRFSEFWMPVRDIGGISRANLDGVVFLKREGDKLHVGLNVNRVMPSARIRVLDGRRPLLDVREPLDPAHTFTREVAGAPAGRKCTFELRDARDRVLLTHTEDTYDWTPASEIRTGPQPAARLDDDALAQGADQELNGRLLAARDTYRRALERTPDRFNLNKAAGRLAATMKDYEAAITYLKRARQQVSNDAEVEYYLGCAEAGLGEAAQARAAWESAQLQPPLRAAARFELAMLDARERRRTEALELLRAAMAEEPDMVRAGAVEVALLRSMGRLAQARERAAHWIREDPTNSFLRYERVRLGRPDESLWRHLGSDPERVLEIAVDYINLGLYTDAVDLLSRQYPPHDPQEAEPGTALPQDYPLVAYYRGFCREELGQAGADDYRAASRMSTRFVFPYRPTTLMVLKRAIARDGGDATAHYLLGNLYMSAGLTDEAIAEWQTARKLNRSIPVLHRNLGLTLLSLKRDDRQAIEVLREGLGADPRNTELYADLTQAMSIDGRPAQERIEVLERYPDRPAMPTKLALDLALTYAEAGRFSDAEGMFRNRHFTKEEGGANVREVYAEAQLQQALSLAKAGRRDEARRVMANLAKPAEGMEFTRDGMEEVLRLARLEYYQGSIEKLAGDEAAARAHWEKAAAGRGVFGVLAARELGAADWKNRASQIANSARFGASFERGMALVALGQADEGRQALHECLRAPDRNLSHYLARRALLAE
jgi:Flp pilus assembly protein TadD